MLTIALVLALQDTRAQEHEDPKPRTGPVRRPGTGTQPVSSNEPQRRGRRAPAPRVYAPPAMVPMAPPAPPSVAYPPRPAPPAPPRYAPAPPAPPLPSPFSRPLTPIGSPQAWITDDDYPAAALRAGAQGTVAFRLDVGADGAPQACTVTSSSGNGALDTVTCSLMMRRARFRPALDRSGAPVPASWSNRMRWVLPVDEPVDSATIEPLSWTRVIQFSIGPNGRVSGCREDYFGRPGILDPGICDRLAAIPMERMKALRGNSGGTVQIRVRYQHAVTGLPLVQTTTAPRGFRPVITQRVTFNINQSGVVTRCRGDLPRLGLPMVAPDCDYRARYGPQSARLTVTVTQSLYSNGDIRVLPALRALLAE